MPTRPPGWLHVFFLACTLALVLFPARVQPQPGATPEPSPTDAAAVAARRLEAEAVAPLPVGLTPTRAQEVARTAALLAASRRLVEQALDNWDFYGTDLKPVAGVRRLYKISPEHPNDALLAWILRSQPKYQEDAQGRVRVVLQSPPMGELAARVPQMSRTTTHDLDGDGVPETVGAGFDGRIYVLKKTPHGFEVLGSTPSQAYYASNTYGLDWEQIRVARLAGIRSVESAGPNRARVVADISIDEEVSGDYAGGALEQREVLVSLQPEAGPEIQLEEPFDFSGTSEESLPMRGVLSAPSGVALARLQFNGRPVWQTPEGLRSKQLKMDLVVPLLPGLNRAQLQALDGARRTVVREVVVRRNAPVAPLDPARRQALVIGIERYGRAALPRVASAEKDAARIRDALVAVGGFKPERVRLLTGEKATREAILAALKSLADPTDNPVRGLTVVYFAGLTAPGADGKTLLPYDASGTDSLGLTARELVSSLGALDNQEALFLGDCGRLSTARPEGVWLDNNDFLSTLERGGWAALSSADPLTDERDGEEGSLFASAVAAGLKGGDGGDGWVELDELYRFVFARLQDHVKKQSLAPQVPLWRGEILGRIPLGRKG